MRGNCASQSTKVTKVWGLCGIVISIGLREIRPIECEWSSLGRTKEVYFAGTKNTSEVERD
jgi:hypothetical protein